jgi:hypothetical protein
MTNHLRLALDDAKETSLAALLFLDQDNPSSRALPNMKAVLRFAAMCHRKHWLYGEASIAQFEAICNQRVGDESTLEKAIASPEWRAAWLAETGIDIKSFMPLSITPIDPKPEAPAWQPPPVGAMIRFQGEDLNRIYMGVNNLGLHCCPAFVSQEDDQTGIWFQCGFPYTITPDPRDARIAELEAKVKELGDIERRLCAWNKSISEAANGRIAELEAKLAAVKAALEAGQ